MLKAPKTIEQERKDFLIPILRKASVRWKYRLIAKEKARRVSQSSNKRLKWEFQDAITGLWHPNEEVQLDHITEIGIFEDWNIFIEKLFCDENNYQVLHKSTHLEKTKKSNSERNEIKRNKKTNKHK